MNRRAEILQELVRYEKPTEPLMRELGSFGWDWDGEPLLTLKKEDLLRIIDRFLVAEIAAEQLEEWAETLECRDDVAFDQEKNELLKDVLFRIANPALNEPLTVESVSKMKRDLLEKEANQPPEPTRAFGPSGSS